MDFAKKMIFADEDRHDFNDAAHYWICKCLFDNDNDRVRVHCHFTGKYREAARYKCNLQFKKPKFTPVIIHNLAGYDSNLSVKNLGKTEENIKCIPNNGEKYISFNKDIVVGSFIDKEGKIVEVKNEFRFLDSFGSIASSLDSLVAKLSY